jgi:hypothetical protein
MKQEIVELWEFGGPLSQIPSEHAWLILFAVWLIGVVGAWLSYRLAVVVLNFPQRVCLVALRAAVFGALLLCLANPVGLERITAEPPAPLTRSSGTEPAGRLAVLVDRSDSMTTADNRGRTRLDDALATWRRFEPAARPVYAEIRYFSFGEDLKAAQTLEEAAAHTGGTGGTHLFEVVADLLKKPKNERPNAVVVLTDGVDNSGESDSLVREAALKAGVPVHIVSGTNRDRPEPFLRVREFDAPTVVLRRTEFLAEASFEAFSREDRTIPFSLWQGDLRIESGTLALSRGSNLIPWNFRVAAGEPGQMDLSLKFDEGSESRVVARATVGVIPDRKINVLVYQGVLDWGFRYIADALKSDPSFQLVRMVNPIFGVTLARDSKDGTTVAGKLTADAARLKAIDCIVMARVYPEQLEETQQEALVNFVREGGTLLFTQPDPEAAGQFNESRLAQLLPVEFETANLATRRTGSRGGAQRLSSFALTEAGRASPIFAHAAVDTRSHLIPRFAEYARASRTRPAAEVLAVHPTERDPGTGQPYVLLATQAFGRGRVAVLTTDGLWRWKLKEPSDSLAVETFWQQLLLAIGRRNEAEHIHFVDQPPHVGVGEIIALRIGGVDARKQPIVTVKSPEGRLAQYPASATGDPAAPWRVRWKPTIVGSWEFEAAVEGDYPTFFFTTAVGQPTGELARVPTAIEPLRALASSTGGLLLVDKPPLAWRTEMLTDRKVTLEPIVFEKRHLRWNTWTLLGAAFAALALEMVLRRFWKMC